MINRTLIRLKVVQMLYSYLLTRSEFSLLPAPEKQTRDSRAAYLIYLDMIPLILELMGTHAANDSKSPMAGIPVSVKLSGSKIAKSLSTDNDIKTLALKRNQSIQKYSTALPALYQRIVDSAAFADYSKLKNPELADDVKFWSTIINTIFINDQGLKDAARQSEEFTGVGFDNAIAMVDRTLREFTDTKSTIFYARKALDKSLSTAYDLYHALFLLMINITREQERRIEAAKDKYLPSAADLNPNMRFVNNKFIAALQGSMILQEAAKVEANSWDNDVYLVRDLLDSIVSSETYREYMEGGEPTFADDCEFWRQVLRNIILPSDDLAEALEAKSVYWNDDLEIMGTFVAKTIKQWATAGNDSPGFLPKYKDEEDAQFGPTLFVDAITNREQYRAYIDMFIDEKQWDTERLAFMDIVIMDAIIAELINFPLIPIAVTLNEYIEIANRYSTPKSGQFINGVMYNIIHKLKEEGKIIK